MAKDYGSYLTQLKFLVKDVSNAFSGDDPYPAALEQAAQEFSHDQPRRIVQEYTSGQGGAFIGTDRTFPLPTFWDDDISVRSYRLEYPVDTSALQDTILDVEQCMLYETPTGSVLRLRAEQWIDQVIEATKVFYLRYWGLHVISTSLVTVPDSRFYAVCNLAASVLCQVMATRTAGLGSVNIQGGQAAYSSQSGQWLTMRKAYYAEYKRLIKPDDDDEAPSGVFINPVTSPLHEYPHGLWPRDNDGRKNLIN